MRPTIISDIEALAEKRKAILEGYIQTRVKYLLEFQEPNQFVDATPLWIQELTMQIQSIEKFVEWIKEQTITEE